MAILEYNSLSLGASNSIVYDFKQLVEFTIHGGEFNSTYGKIKRRIATLDNKLYDKAISLPESKMISFEYLDETTKYKYGKFIGSKLYKTFDGEYDSNTSLKPGESGWLIQDNSSYEYCLFTNGVRSYIISIYDFEPQPIIKDFTPLYNILKSRIYSNSKHNFYTNDLCAPGALATTFRNEIIQNIIETLYFEWVIFMSAYHTVSEFRYVIGLVENKEEIRAPNVDSRWLLIDIFEHKNVKNFYTDNYNASQIKYVDNKDPDTSAYHDVQAIIYDLPNESDRSLKNGSSAQNVLFCFQQPDSVSYTSSASFEPVSPRGTQQPFQFYQSANQISLSFALKFHEDEVRTLKIGNNKTLSLQDVAKIAEEFTRPWCSSESNESLKPKLIKVILPGVSEVGYMTSVSITYSGEMCGSSNTFFYDGSDTSFATEVKEKDKTVYVDAPLTDYHYNGLEINFELLIVKDITLKAINQSVGNSITLENDIARNKEAENTYFNNSDNGSGYHYVLNSPLEDAPLTMISRYMDAVEGVAGATEKMYDAASALIKV